MLIVQDILQHFNVALYIVSHAYGCRLEHSCWLLSSVDWKPAHVSVHQISCRAGRCALCAVWLPFAWISSLCEDECLILVLQSASWPATLAQICDTIQISTTTSDPANSQVCQSFTYNSQQKIAYFKGQQANSSTGVNDMCISPYITTWLLNAGRFCNRVLLGMHIQAKTSLSHKCQLVSYMFTLAIARLCHEALLHLTIQAWHAHCKACI